MKRKVITTNRLAATFLIFSALHPGMPITTHATQFMNDLPYSDITPIIIQTDLPAEDDGRGGIIVNDLNNDGLMDFIVSKPGIVGAYDNSGRKLWICEENIQLTSKSEDNGLPGWHAPGTQSGDIDGDGRVEMLFLTTDNRLVVLDGKNGNPKNIIQPALAPGIEKWEHFVIADFHGAGGKDILLQATNPDGYRMGKYLRAYAFSDLINSNDPEPLWEKSDYVAAAHNGVRVADMDGDGKDEIQGGVLLDHKGREKTTVPLKGHIDAHMVADVLPSVPGLEMVVLEESVIDPPPFDGSIRGFYTLNRLYKKYISKGNRIFLVGTNGLIWKAHHNLSEPQNTAVGDFDPDRPGLEIWCRSRYDTHQKPFVFDSEGNVITSYAMDDVAPEGWTEKGVEVPTEIHWTGNHKQFVAGKERHRSGDVAIFDAMTGKFLHRFKENADRLYVADVYGDWREEILVMNKNEIHIYKNPDPNLNPDRDSLWIHSHYRRNKMTYNYYSN
ncbi:MAG: FG-GAP-like repeat-containing protein [Desulfobacterales bacterium]